MIVYEVKETQEEYIQFKKVNTTKKCDAPPPPRHEASQRSQTGAEGIAQHRHLEIGSRVEAHTPEGVQYGTIRWIGTFPDVKQKIAGVELVSLFYLNMYPAS